MAFKRISKYLQCTDSDDDGFDMDEQEMTMFVKKFKKFMKSKKGYSSQESKKERRSSHGRDKG